MCSMGLWVCLYMCGHPCVYSSWFLVFIVFQDTHWVKVFLLNSELADRLGCYPSSVRDEISAFWIWEFQTSHHTHLIFTWLLVIRIQVLTIAAYGEKLPLSTFTVPPLMQNVETLWVCQVLSLPAVDKTPDTQFLLKWIQQIYSIFMWTNFNAMNYMMLYDTYKICGVCVCDSLAEDMKKNKSLVFL